MLHLPKVKKLTGSVLYDSKLLKSIIATLMIPVELKLY